VTVVATIVQAAADTGTSECLFGDGGACDVLAEAVSLFISQIPLNCSLSLPSDTRHYGG
jgi:hypothetical protein